MSSKQKSANTDDIISKIKELESETHGSKEKLNNIPVLIDYLAVCYLTLFVPINAAIKCRK
jgi:hypothetical protein